MMNDRVKVKEPPRNGDPGRARYHLKDSADGGQTIGWSGEMDEAVDWLTGFGEWSTVYVFDRETRTVIRPTDATRTLEAFAQGF